MARESKSCIIILVREIQTGSYNKDEAIEMIKGYKADDNTAYIAVVSESESDNECIDEIHEI